jgi:ACS family hexuronate transporter-like MFS transporter
MRVPGRWIAVGVFVLSSSLNYLDRQLFSALAPVIRGEFGWSYEDYGRVVSYFSLVYAVAAPLMGLVIDRIGLNAGVTLAVGVWSAATVWTGWARELTGLIASRFLLGAAQGGGVPAAGKAMSTYLEPRERALGQGMSQVGLSVGMIAAPLLAGFMEPRFGWRSAFLVGGSLGLIWVPLWLLVARSAPRQVLDPGRRQFAVGEMLRSSGYWGLIVATMLVMTVYSLWSNWTTPYLVKAWGMEAAVVNRTLAWIPPLIGAVGGIFGGAASMKMKGNVAESRRRAALFGAVAVALATALVPFAGSPLLAALCIGISYSCTTMMSVNLYALPLDLFGLERAAFGAASLTGAYGLMQTVISPAIGYVVDRQGFAPVCLGVAMLPLLGVGLLYVTRER